MAETAQICQRILETLDRELFLAISTPSTAFEGMIALLYWPGHSIHISGFVLNLTLNLICVKLVHKSFFD